MKIENTKVAGIEIALKAMRNPKDSWNHKKLSDIKLTQSLTKAGPEHCKHLRMIQVWADMTLPRFVWQEFDTYKHVEKVSCSTMHTITKRKLTQSDFEMPVMEEYLDMLNHYLVQDTAYAFRKLKNGLPEGFLQMRTVNTNYAQLLNIYKQRKSHKLPQWRNICSWILELPQFKELTGVQSD